MGGTLGCDTLLLSRYFFQALDAQISYFGCTYVHILQSNSINLARLKEMFLIQEDTHNNTYIVSLNFDYIKLKNSTLLPTK